MAEAAAVSTLFRMIANKLAPLLERELSFLWSVRDEAVKLQTTLSLIQDVMADAEERSIRERAVHDWLTKLADVAYDVDDVLNEFHTEALLRRSALRRGFFVQVSSFFSLSNPLVFRLRMGHKISSIREKLQVIAKERTEYQLREGVVSEWRINVGERETHSFVAEDEVYGRGHDKEKIVDMLINTEEDVDVAVIPICGMGGLGKTTLAQLVYNDARVGDHFSKRMWAFVSEVFDLKKVIRSIISTATEVECHLSDMELLQRSLGEALSGSKYLLVLDDVWTGCQQNWDGLMRLLRRGGSRGSKIIVTTRSSDVAEMTRTRTVMPLHLDGLSDDDCWKVFKRRAFGTMGGEVNQRLEAIGKQIVRKCGGVPLAAESLGGLLQFQEEEWAWLNVRDSEIWQLPEDGRGILGALKLTYDHLPSPLKQCFAYCSLFPKGYEFVEDDLIEMWIAEGFILSSGYHKQQEDIGKDYVNILLSCSFFGARKAFGKWRLKMHDLVHDLACSVASDRFCLLTGVGDMKLVPLKCRHLAMDEPTMASTNFQAANQLHSFHLIVDEYNWQGKSSEEALSTLLATLSRLRVLEMSYAPIVRVPKSIGKLKHLRYINLSFTKIATFPKCIGNLQNLRTLDLSATKIETLPECLGNLQNLMTLNLSDCVMLKILPQALSNLQSLVTLDLCNCCALCELPKGTSNLTNLKHLEVEYCNSLTKTPPGIGKLGNLQKLSCFYVGKERGCSIAELQFLNQLRGRLVLRGIENVENEADALRANLKEKQELKSVTLTWDSSVFQQNAERVLEALRPPPNIRKLQITGYAGLALPSWLKTPTVQSSLANLVSLSLYGFEKCESLPSLGKLPSLKKLRLESFPMVKCIHAEFYGDAAFMSLEELVLRNMPNLEEWSTRFDRSQVFPCLGRLVIDSCPKLIAQPCLPASVVELRLWDSHELLLSEESFSSFSASLKQLHIGSCKTSFGWKGLQRLTALELLTVECCSCLPESIKRLLISGCTVSLMGCELPEWIEGLASLRNLNMDECNNLSVQSEVEHFDGFFTYSYTTGEGCTEEVPQSAAPEQHGSCCGIKCLNFEI